MRNDRSSVEVDLEDPALARSFLLFYLFEIWEKILQTLAFVNSKEHRRKRRMWAVIGNYSDVLHRLARQLDETSAAYCRQLIGGKELVFDDYVQAVAAANDVVQALLGLHGKLNLLTGRTENQITYDFVRKLAVDSAHPQQGSWLPSVPSIALTDMYNFIEHDLRHILSLELEQHGLEPLDPQSRNVVLALPKAEADNPLMWAILAHEMAHTMISSYKILDNEILARTPEYLKAKQNLSREVYRNWSLEICADLIALRLLGPSYFFSFASMGLLLDPQPETEVHPAIIERIGIMAKVMTLRHSEWTIRCPNIGRGTFTQEDLIPFFQRLALYKHELWSLPRYRTLFLPMGSFVKADALELRPNVDLILDSLDRVHVPAPELAPSAKLGGFVETLSTGQPISSCLIEGFDRDSFSSKLQEVTNAQQLYGILPPPEEPLTLSTILACGWMHKVYVGYADLLEQMMAEQSLVKTSKIYDKMLANRNELLLNSLSHAFMMQMYWRWRAVLDEQSGEG
jgi:hypothetical protein